MLSREEEVQINIPKFHLDQVRAYEMPGRLKAIRCGRRWGKTQFGEGDACSLAMHGEPIGWFAPDYKVSSEVYNEIADILAPVTTQSSQTAGVIRTIGGGRIDFWTLDNERAGRSRKYKKVFIDEGAFTKPNMIGIWEKSILPTLLDLDGTAVVMSNTNGIDPENFFWAICNEPRFNFSVYHAPSFNNPYVPVQLPGESAAEHVERRVATFRELKKNNLPLVYQQEFLAEFVDWSGVAFFSLDSLLVNKQPVEPPPVMDAVFAIVDSATKTGKKNDGTGVVYYGVHKLSGTTHKLTILDWDVQQIEGALLEHWLPTVFDYLKSLTQKYRCRAGSLGVWIEDKNSGMVLIQQATNRNWPARAIDSKLTSLGKSERAISVSGYVYQGLVKLSRLAFDKVTTYKGTTRNHLLSQVIGFRIGEKESADNPKDDDLLDGFCYGVAIALGDAGGF